MSRYPRDMAGEIVALDGSLVIVGGDARGLRYLTCVCTQSDILANQIELRGHVKLMNTSQRWNTGTDAFPMVASGMLQSPSVQRWLGGIEPAWTLLEFASFNALHQPPSPSEGPIRLAANLSPQEIQQSAVARNAIVLLRAAAVGPGLKVTATGNLGRAVVAEMIDAFAWPGFDRIHEFRLHKVVNEPDYLPLFFVRHLAEAAKVLCKHKGHLRITSAGRRLLIEANVGAMQALLFHLTFWYLNLSYLGGGIHGNWPLYDIGVVLWCLSVAANDWETRENLTRLCTVPIIGVLEATWDTGSMAMEARVLRPLWWFGLLEYRQAEVDGKPTESGHMYRKTALFDRFLAFDIVLEMEGGVRH